MYKINSPNHCNVREQYEALQKQNEKKSSESSPCLLRFESNRKFTLKVGKSEAAISPNFIQEVAEQFVCQTK